MPSRLVSDVIRNQQLVTASAQATVFEAVRLMRERHVAALLVVDDGRLAGIFTERDAVFRVLAEERDARSTRVAEVMTRDPRTITAERPFAHALHMMYDGGFRHMPVVDNGRPVGIVSARDVLGREIQEFESDLERRERIGEIIG